jgi:hypothetical protein
VKRALIIYLFSSIILFGLSMGNKSISQTRMKDSIMAQKQLVKEEGSCQTKTLDKTNVPTVKALENPCYITNPQQTSIPKQPSPKVVPPAPKHTSGAGSNNIFTVIRTILLSIYQYIF